MRPAYECAGPLQVVLGDRSYPIHVAAGCLDRAEELLMSADRPSSVVIICGSGPVRRYGEQVEAALRRAGIPTTLLSAQVSERRKTLRTVAGWYERMLDAGLDRAGLIIGVGGGVIGDMAGFAAATYMRGVPVAQAPTTLLAQVDASVGGKTGVNLRRGKNIVGAFHQPRVVLIDPLTLLTLPAREVRSGLAEVIKHGIIRDGAFLDRLDAEMPDLLRRDVPALTHAVRRSCEIKAEVVGADETEQGIRAVLNYGHTVGHAVESVTDYRAYRHGEAVAIGMVVECCLGEELGLTPASVTLRVTDVLARARLPVRLPDTTADDALLAVMMTDKKAVGGALRFALIADIGKAVIVPDVPTSAVRRALDRARRV